MKKDLEERLEYERLYTDFTRQSETRSFREYATVNDRMEDYRRMLYLCGKHKSVYVYEVLRKL